MKRGAWRLLRLVVDALLAAILPVASLDALSMAMPRLRRHLRRHLREPLRKRCYQPAALLS